MKRSILLACVMVVAFGRLAFADIEDCEVNPNINLKLSLAAAMNFVNDIEVQDAKAALCQSTHTACMAACMDAEQNHQLDPPAEGEEERGEHPAVRRPPPVFPPKNLPPFP